jgi:CBS domain-containing protein
MQAIEATRRRVVTVSRDTSIADAAQLMNDQGIGALVVVENERIAGIVTDRDIVVRCVARRMAADGRIDSIMTTPVVTLPYDAELRVCFDVFRSNAVRRLPLVDDGKLAGMLTVDDLFIDVAADLADLVRPVTGETIFGYREQAAPLVVP